MGDQDTLLDVSEVSEISDLIAQIEAIRYGMISEGGGSIIYPVCAFDGLWDFIWFTPKALLIGWFAPFPGDLISPGTTGAMKFLGGMENILIWCLLPSMLCGVWRSCTRPGIRAVSLFMLLFMLNLFTLLGMGVPNVGTLVRLRIPAMTLFVLFASIGLAEE